MPGRNPCGLARNHLNSFAVTPAFPAGPYWPDFSREPTHLHGGFSRRLRSFLVRVFELWYSDEFPSTAIPFMQPATFPWMVRTAVHRISSLRLNTIARPTTVPWWTAHGFCPCITPPTAPSSGSLQRAIEVQPRCCSRKVIDSHSLLRKKEVSCCSANQGDATPPFLTVQSVQTDKNLGQKAHWTPTR